MPTLERIGSRICPVLVKLAEISFLQADFQSSEKTVDAILTRQTPDQTTLLFAYLMKAYFSTLSTQPELAQTYFQKAQQMQPGVKVSDLDLFKRVKARQQGASVLLRNQSYQAIQGTDDRCVVELTAQSVNTFPAFLMAFIDNIASASNSEAFAANSFVYDCSAWIKVLEQSSKTFQLNWHQQEVVQLETTTVVQPQTKSERNKNLRKKPDNTEQQIKAIRLHRFTPYREFLQKNQEFEAQSTFQIAQIAQLMANSRAYEQMQVCQAQAPIDQPDIGIIEELCKVLRKQNKTNCQYFVRSLLEFLCTRRLVTASNAKKVFKLFCFKIDEASLAITHPQVVQTMFELALFNQEVIKETKSGPIMRLRTQLYDFCSQKNQAERFQCPLLRFRMTYALMFTAFEIKHDMQQAVAYYDQLKLDVLQQPLYLKWVSSTFHLSLETVSNFGNQKIREAQRINQQNQALRTIKQIESETTRTAYQRQPCTKLQALFYVEQLFLQLQMLVEVNETTNVNFHMTDEKIKEVWDQLLFCLVRVQPIDQFFITTNHVFCVLSAFKSLTNNKSLLHETVVLKKIDLEPLLQEISERSKQIIIESGALKAEYSACDTLTKQYLESRNLTKLILSQTQTHIARLLTSEFIFWNAKVGGSMGNVQDPGQPFATQLLRCLFMLEQVQSNLAKDQMFGVALLMKQLDQMAQEQQELLMRAYSRLFTVAFPIMLRAYINGASHSDFKLLIEKSFKYLFGFAQFEAQTDFSEEMQIDLDEVTELSLFAGMQTQADKPKYPVPPPSQIFTTMALNLKKEIDFQFLTDVVIYVDSKVQGRLLNAQLTQQDATNCVKVADSIAKILIAHNKREDEAQLVRQKCFVENPFSQIVVRQDPSLHYIIKFLLNIFGSLAIAVFPSTAVMPITKRLPLVEKLASLKDLRKLKFLASLDLISSHDQPASALNYSIIELQHYLQHLQDKLTQDYKPDSELRKYKETATNAAIWALKEGLHQQNLAFCLKALHQLLSIILARVLSKRNTQNSKFQTLVANCYCLAMICELVQCCLTSPRKDPRLQNISTENLHQQARLIIENLLVAIQSTYEHGIQRQGLINNIHDHLSGLRELSQQIDQLLYKHLPKSELNPDYPCIQVLITQLAPSDVSQLELQVSKKAFDLAVCQNDHAVGFESLSHLFERNLQFIVDYKYTKANADVIKGFLDQTKVFLSDAEVYLSKYPNREEEILFDLRASHLMRAKLLIPNQDQVVEGILHRLYKLGDSAVALISEGSLALKWTSLKLKMMLQQSLVAEAKHSNRDCLKLLSESTAPQLFQELCEIEESIIQKNESFGQQPIFYLQHLSMCCNTVQERSQKSLVSMYFSSSVHKSINGVRMLLKQQLLQLWEETQNYEAIQTLYRKCRETFKKNSEKVIEVVESFNRAKDTLIRTMKQVSERLLQDYLQLRRKVIEFKKGQKTQAESSQMFKDFRSKYELTPQNPVGLVRDIFELFLDANYSKQFLKRQGMITQQQKADIRCALFNICALCGPDEETEPGAPKFIDLHKFTEDNWKEALQVCVKWYTNYIEQHRKAKKEQDMAKRLINCAEELKQETLGDVLATPKKSQTAKHEVSAAKVFSQKKLI